MRARLGALVMGALLLLYLVVVVQFAIEFLTADEPIAKAIGVALLVLPLIGAWVLVAEILFGVRSERLSRRLAAEGLMPFADITRSASGRPDRQQADAAFPAFRDDVEQHPASWQAWLRLGMAYDASGDRRRARWAVRQAIRVERDPAAASEA